jgi:GDP-4-dehydro-6-deoxy-D-mannose reductase
MPLGRYDTPSWNAGRFCMPGVLITGAAGMVGSHLLERLAADGAEVVASYFRPTIRLADIAGFPLQELDVRYAEPVRRMIAAQRPDTIFHLAAQSLPVVSWRNPWETLEVNVIGTVNVFEAVRSVRADIDAAYDPIVVVACSSAEYGASLTADQLPVDEEAPLLPLHPYGVSKVAQDLLAFQYFRNERIRCIRARIFNCTGPRKQTDVVSDFCRRVAEIARTGTCGVLRVGNLATHRAILDVRDLVDGLLALAERGVPGEAYNICAEQTVRIGELVPLLERLAGVRLVPEIDLALLRPSDEKAIWGRTEKLTQATGWRQRVALEETVAAVLDYERGA